MRSFRIIGYGGLLIFVIRGPRCGVTPLDLMAGPEDGSPRTILFRSEYVANKAEEGLCFGLVYLVTA